jgi:hypothetical protein
MFPLITRPVIKDMHATVMICFKLSSDRIIEVSVGRQGRNLTLHFVAVSTFEMEARRLYGLQSSTCRHAARLLGSMTLYEDSVWL